MNSKRKNQVQADVLKAYAEKYPDWTNTRVMQVVENRVFDILVGVHSDQELVGEMCIVQGREVHIFDTTPEFMRYVDLKASRIVTLKEILVVLIIVAMLAIFAGVVFGQKDPGAISMVTSAVSGILGTFVGVKISSKDEKA